MSGVSGKILVNGNMFGMSVTMTILNTTMNTTKRRTYEKDSNDISTFNDSSCL